MQTAIVIEPGRDFASSYGDRRPPREAIIATTATHWSRILYVDLFEGAQDVRDDFHRHPNNAGRRKIRV